MNDIKLKKFTSKQWIAMIVSLAIVVAVFLMTSQSYFNSKEIRTASERCLENEGIIIVEKTFLNLGYSFYL